MKKSVRLKNFKSYLLLALVSILNLAVFAQTVDDQTEIPELVFKNPALVSGTANKQGAIYKFSNVAPGIDATITLLKFSSPSIVMTFIDRSDIGWDKAFQPEFGIPGNVPSYSKWWIDFRLNFYEAGTSTPMEVDKFSLSTIDVDGDGVSIQEWVTLKGASTVKYSPVSYLAQPPQVLPVCKKCSKSSWSIVCTDCLGTGLNPKDLLKGKKKKCSNCNGVGLLFAICGHPWGGSDAQVNGPTQNFNNIDTSATQVMATYVYDNINSFDFTYGAQSNAVVSNAGVRMNSMWFKSFNLSPAVTLPVKLTNFSALYDKKNVSLSWTANEENFSRYRVQRSTDGRDFSDIAIITTTSKNGDKSYVYKDANVSSAPGVLYYRLAMIDQTEELTYSPTRVIKLGKETEATQLATYPNPVTDQLRVTLPQAWQGKAVMLEVYASNGNKVKNLQVGSASQTETLPMASLSKGFYVVKASCDDQVSQQGVIKN